MKAKSIEEIQSALVECKDNSLYLILRIATRQNKFDKSGHIFTTKPPAREPGRGYH